MGHESIPLNDGGTYWLDPIKESGKNNLNSPLDVIGLR
jgi:hypothetical protein